MVLITMIIPPADDDAHERYSRYVEIECNHKAIGVSIHNLFLADPSCVALLDEVCTQGLCTLSPQQSPHSRMSCSEAAT